MYKKKDGYYRGSSCKYKLIAHIEIKDSSFIYTPEGMYFSELTINKIIPCKVSEQVLYDKNTLISPFIINKKNSKEKENSFDRIINSYIYYNCQNAELGYYPHYFVEESIYNSYRKEMKQ